MGRNRKIYSAFSLIVNPIKRFSTGIESQGELGSSQPDIFCPGGAIAKKNIALSVFVNPISRID